jgi:DNA-binding CsgD family transcriptional regulator
MMNKGAIVQLTETQKACLRLVFQHQSSKDIARHLGSSPHTIDNHIKAAMARLGAVSRVEAARELANQESHDERRTLASPCSVLSPDMSDPYPNDTNSSGVDGYEVEKTNTLLFEERSPYSVEGLVRERRNFLPLPQFWGQANDLTTTKTIGWILAIAIMICLALGAIMASLSALNDLL